MALVKQSRATVVMAFSSEYQCVGASVSGSRCEIMVGVSRTRSGHSSRVAGSSAGETKRGGGFGGINDRCGGGSLGSRDGRKPAIYVGGLVLPSLVPFSGCFFLLRGGGGFGGVSHGSRDGRKPAIYVGGLVLPSLVPFSGCFLLLRGVLVQLGCNQSISVRVPSVALNFRRFSVLTDPSWSASR